MRNYKGLTTSLVAGALLVMALGLPPVSAADNQLAGVTTSRLTCNQSSDGDNQKAGRPITFYFQVVNNGTETKVVRPRFDLPAKAMPSASPLIKVGLPMVQANPVYPDVCLTPASGLSATSQIQCHPARTTSVELTGWICPKLAVPAQRWRWFTFKVSFRKVGNRWTRFWVTSGNSQTRPDTIKVG